MLEWKREDKYIFDIKPFENKEWSITGAIINGKFSEFIIEAGSNLFIINSKDSLIILKQIVDNVCEKSGLSTSPVLEGQRMVDLK